MAWLSGSGSRFLLKVVVQKMVAGLPSPEGWNGAEGSVSKMADSHG